jgi:hypothetical protein
LKEVGRKAEALREVLRADEPRRIAEAILSQTGLLWVRKWEGEKMIRGKKRTRRKEGRINRKPAGGKKSFGSLPCLAWKLGPNVKARILVARKVGTYRDHWKRTGAAKR